MLGSASIVVLKVSAYDKWLLHICALEAADSVLSDPLPSCKLKTKYSLALVTYPKFMNSLAPLGNKTAVTAVYIVR